MEYPLVGKIATYSYLIPVLTGIFIFKKLQRRGKIYFLFFVLNMFGVFIETVIANYHVNNQWFINIFRTVELLYFIELFSIWIPSSKVKMFSWVLFISFLIFSILNTHFFLDPNSINSSDEVFSNVIHIILSGIILYYFVKDDLRSTLQDYRVLFASGILLYNAGIILIFAFSNTLLKMGMEYFDVAWHFNWSLTIIINVLFGYSIYIVSND